MAVLGTQIRKVAVLGAGTMGSRIAAHVANAGVPVVLLDIVPPGTAADAGSAEKNKFVLAAMDGLKKSKPAAFYAVESARLISIGNFEDDLALVKDCDWIIEVVAENLEIKAALLKRVEEHRRAGSILTSNTSGIPIGSIAATLSDEAASPLLWDSLLQSAAVYATAGDHPYGEDERGAMLRCDLRTFAIRGWARPLCGQTIRRTSLRTGLERSRWGTRSD